jgi:hypothetical protein
LQSLDLCKRSRFRDVRLALDSSCIPWSVIMAVHLPKKRSSSETRLQSDCRPWSVMLLQLNKSSYLREVRLESGCKPRSVIGLRNPATRSLVRLVRRHSDCIVSSTSVLCCPFFPTVARSICTHLAFSLLSYQLFCVRSSLLHCARLSSRYWNTCSTQSKGS